MDSLVRAATAWLVMATTALICRSLWDDSWPLAGALFYAFVLPLVLAVLLPLPGYRWPSIAATAAGVALGLGFGIAIQFASSDSGADTVWLAAAVWALLAFPVCATAAAAARVASELLRLR